MPLNPCEKTLNQPPTLVAPQPSSILGFWFNPVLFVWRDYLYTLIAQFIVQFIAIVSFVTNKIVWLGFDHIKVQAQLNQGDFMVIGSVSSNRQWKTMLIDNSHDFHAFSAFCQTNLISAAFRRCKGCINETFRFIQGILISKGIGKINHDVPNDVVIAPRLEATMNRFVIGIALWKHMPLRTGI